MAINNEATKLLQGVFPDHGTYAIFANAKYDPVTKKLGTWQHYRSVDQLDNLRDCFLCSAAFPDDGIAVRTGARAVEVRALVVDDVGTPQVPAADVLKALGPPTFEVLTSANSAHWWYALVKPVPVAEWPDFFEEIERLVGHTLDGSEAHHVFRLPMGVNTKAKHKGFKPCLGQINPGVKLDAEAIMLFAPPKVASMGASGGGGCYAYRDMVGLAALIPNPDSLLRKPWVDHGYWFKAAADNEDAGFEGFVAWSQKNSFWYDGDDTEKLWRGIKRIDDTSGRELLVEAEAADPDGYQAWIGREAAGAFDDGTDFSLVGLVSPAKPGPITATEYAWIDPDKIEPRDWLYGHILIRSFITMTVAPGGVGKSSLIAVETLAQVTGKNLLGEKPSGELRVWLWNLEDPNRETQRKIQAAALHYGLVEADLGRRLFVDSGRDQRLVMAVMERNAPTIVRPVVRALVEQIKLRGIDIIVIDPFVSCHGVPENDNTAQDMVVKEWGRVAEEGGCAVHLVDHTSKAGSKEVVTDSSRGAKAKTDAARVVRVLNKMTDAQNKLWSVATPWRYFSTFNDKANMAPPIDRQDWFYLESVGLGNGSTAAAAFGGGVNAAIVPGDDVGVVTRWVPPSAKSIAAGTNFQKMVEEMGDQTTLTWRKDYQAKENWIGIPAARALGLNVKIEKDRKQVKDVLSEWFNANLLEEVPQLDKHRNEKIFIKIAQVF